jgi:hypothetical protein
MSKASKKFDAVARGVELALHTQDWYDSRATSRGGSVVHPGAER